MAQTVTIPDVGSTAKIRNPWGTLALALVTLGIYSLVWWYKINRELRDLGRAERVEGLGDSPGLSTLAMALGGLTGHIATVWTIVTTSRRIYRAQKLTDARGRFNGWIAAALWIFTLGLGSMVYTQAQLNRVWRTDAVEAYGSLSGGASLAYRAP